MDIDFGELSGLLNKTINNIGDPAHDGLVRINTHEFEREVVAFFAKLMRANTNDVWGYVTNGSSESNMFALNLAREKLPKATVYYSEAAHYSVPKYARMLRIPGQKVAINDKHEMDYDDLYHQLSKQADKSSAIVVATIGTTMAEARDNIHQIRRAARRAKINSLYIHADAALAGIHSALLSPRHAFDFADGADSVCISGHKFIGTPMPCGVVLVKREYRDFLTTSSNYTGMLDTTITGSRNGHSPMMMWYVLEKLGIKGLKNRAHRAMEVAEYTLERLHDLGWTAWRNPQALTIMFVSPSRQTCSNWQLATHEGWSHIICMPGVTKHKVDGFLAKLQHQSAPVIIG